MKNWHWFLIGFLVASIAAFFVCRHFQQDPSGTLQNDSLNVAHTETEKAIAGVDSLEKSESIRVPKTDSIINKKYENKNSVFHNYDLDSLYRERIRTIEELDTRQCPY